VESILLKQALGLKPSNNFRLQKRAAAYYFSNLPPGFLTSIRGVERAKSIKGVHKIFCGLKLDDKIEPLENKTSRKCLFLIKGKSREDIGTTIKEIRNTVTFFIKKGNRTITVSA